MLPALQVSLQVPSEDAVSEYYIASDKIFSGGAGAERRSEPCGWCGSFEGRCACEKEFLALLYKTKSAAAHQTPKDVDGKEDLPSCCCISTVADSEESLAGFSDTEATEAVMEPAPEPEGPVVLPEWQGMWNFRRVEGNFEELMVDAGVSYFIRQMAHKSNYGIGLATQQIEQNGENLTIHVSNGLMTTTMELIVNGVEQRTVSEDGYPIFITAKLEDGVLSLDGRNEKTGKPLQKTRRYMCEDEMIIETTTSTGFVVKRIFRRD